MKQKKKKGGFTMVEIIVAFAIFSIFAVMIVQVLNLTINRRKSNNDLQKDMAAQEQNLYAKKHETSYDEATSGDGSIILNFGDTSMTVDYQLKSAKDGVSDQRAGINYFVGNIDYDVEGSGSVTEGGDEDPDDPNKQGGAQTDRFDTRITGTKRFSSINVNSVNKVDAKTYTINVSANTAGMLADDKDYAQFTMFFGKPSENLKITKLTPSAPSSVTVRKSGTRGVKVGVTSKGGSISGVSFTIEFDKAPAEDITVNSFGENAVNGKYTAYTSVSGGKTYLYDNLYGVYPKSTPVGGES